MSAQLVAGIAGAAAAALAAVCAAGDAALLAVDPEEPPSRDAVAGLVLRRERVHRALIVARTLLHLVVGAAAVVALRLEARPLAFAVLLALVVALVTVAVTESLAHAAGDGFSTRALEGVAPILSAVTFVLAPVALLWDASAERLRGLLPPADEDGEETQAEAGELRQLVTGTGAPPENAVAGEQHMLHGVFSLGEIEVKDIMVPRVDIVGIEWDTPWSEVLARVRASEHARFPVYIETLDDLRGILYAKDLLPAVIAGDEPAGGWQELVRPITSFIPGPKPIDAQLRDFQASRTHIAIVVDEYGGTSGLVTIEDILEEIFGEIRDEYDDEEPAIVQEEGRRFWVAGEVPVDELHELLEEEFDLEEVSTVGGLVYAALGRVPRAGEAFTLGSYRVVVEQVRRRRVKRVYFERSEALASRENGR